MLELNPIRAINILRILRQVNNVYIDTFIKEKLNQINYKLSI